MPRTDDLAMLPPAGESVRAHAHVLAAMRALALEYHDPVGVRTEFEWMMGEATQDDPPFEYIIVYKLRNFSWSLDETVLCRVKLNARGFTLTSTMESSP